jgi:hypothetical protein
MWNNCNGYEKSSEEKILPEYFFHLEQIYIDKLTIKNVVSSTSLHERGSNSQLWS